MHQPDIRTNGNPQHTEPKVKLDGSFNVLTRSLTHDAYRKRDALELSLQSVSMWKPSNSCVGWIYKHSNQEHWLSEGLASCKQGLTAKGLKI
jgi:hypothetical protein